MKLIASLYSDTASAVKCGTIVSDFFPIVTGVRQGCVLALLLLSASMDWIINREVVEGTGCGASFGEVEITLLTTQWSLLRPLISSQRPSRH